MLAGGSSCAGIGPCDIDGLKNVLQAAVETRVSRFVHVSSVAVYGDNPPAAASSETAAARRTGNPYGDIKLEQEEIVAHYGKRYGLPFVILRPPHIFGPLSHFAKAVAQRLSDGALPIVEDGTNVCNLVYVDNFVEALLLSLERDEALGETFFVVDKERVTWRQCLEDFGTMLGLPVPSASPDQFWSADSPSTRDSLRRIAGVMFSRELRSAVLELPGMGALGRFVCDRYAASPEKRQNYIRARLRRPAGPSPRGTDRPRYDAADYLITSQRRTVVHSCEKAERLLGYTSSIGYVEAMALTRNWLQFAGLISQHPELRPTGSEM